MPLPRSADERFPPCCSFVQSRDPPPFTTHVSFFSPPFIASRIKGMKFLAMATEISPPPAPPILSPSAPLPSDHVQFLTFEVFFFRPMTVFRSLCRGPDGEGTISPNQPLTQVFKSLGADHSWKPNRPTFTLSKGMQFLSPASSQIRYQKPPRKDEKVPDRENWGKGNGGSTMQRGGKTYRSQKSSAHSSNEKPLDVDREGAVLQRCPYGLF